jgi:hypothetical protein
VYLSLKNVYGTYEALVQAVLAAVKQKEGGNYFSGFKVEGKKCPDLLFNIKTIRHKNMTFRQIKLSR